MKIAQGIEVFELNGTHGLIYPVLLFDDANVVLVDTGFPEMMEQFEKAFGEAGFSTSQVNKIVLTHQDIDHIGCLNEFKAVAPQVEVLAHKEEAPYIQGDKPPTKLAVLEANYDTLPPQMRDFLSTFKQAFENRKTKIDTLLLDGDVLPICGGVEIIHTPGHTPGHICLYVRSAKMLIAGDSMNLVDGKLVGPKAQHTPDMALAMESLKKMKAFDIETVVCYHGGVLKEHVKEAFAEL